MYDFSFWRFFTAFTYIDCTDIFELQIPVNCSDIDEKISIATVYRTVKLFEAEGLVHKHHFGDSKARYEISSSCHHDHLIDVNTGEVIEFNNETFYSSPRRIEIGVNIEI